MILMSGRRGSFSQVVTPDRQEPLETWPATRPTIFALIAEVPQAIQGNNHGLVADLSLRRSPESTTKVHQHERHGLTVGKGAKVSRETIRPWDCIRLAKKSRHLVRAHTKGTAEQQLGATARDEYPSGREMAAAVKSSGNDRTKFIIQLYL